MTARIDRTGQAIGRLTFLKVDPADSRKWICSCQCGNTGSFYTANIIKGFTASCGCLSKEKTSARSRKDVRVKDDPAYRSEYSRKYRTKNREVILAKQAEYREANKSRLSEQKRQCYQKNRTAYIERVKENYRKNPESSIRRERQKNSLRKEATPAWADPDAIKKIYLERASLTEETGVLHHVDHIIPLRHPLVCGLHVETNLQVVPAADNWRKHNSYSVDGLAWD